MSGARPRPQQCRSRPGLVIRLQQRMLAARGGPGVLRMTFRSFSNGQVGLQLLGRRIDVCGFQRYCRRLKGVLLLVRWSETLREIAGGLRSRSGCSERASGSCGGSLEAGLISGLERSKVFEVEFGGCGGWFGLLSEALERWMFGG